MNKKFLCILLAVCLAAALTACGGTGSNSDNSTPSDNVGAVTSPSGDPDTAFAFESNGVTISINENMADVLAALGEPQSYFEAESCAFAGLDKTYTYAGFTITTRPDGDDDYVNSILLTDDSVTTPEGVYIGCSVSDVTAAYGEAEQAEGVLKYTKGDCAMNFVLENDTVISIEYLPV